MKTPFQPQWTIQPMPAKGDEGHDHQDLGADDPLFAAAESGEVEIVDDRPGKPFPRPGCGDRNHQRGNRLGIHAHTIELKRDNSTGAALRQPLADVDQEEEEQPAFAGGEEIGHGGGGG